MSSSTSSSDAPGRLAHDRASVPSGAAEARVRDGGASDGGGTAGAPTWSRTRDRAEGAPVTVAAGRPWWHHVRVPAFVLAALLLVEVGVRAVEERLSIDVRHINRMDEIVTALVAAPGPSVLFVGNSLTREGVDLELMRA